MQEIERMLDWSLEDEPVPDDEVLCVILRFFLLSFLEGLEKGEICHLKRKLNFGCRQTFFLVKCKKK